MLPVSPRQLVSEEGGIINLEVDNEFDVPEVRNLRPKKIRGVHAKQRARQVSKVVYDSEKMPSDSRYLTTAATGPMGVINTIPRGVSTIETDAELNKTEHSKFLVELMSPFAGRAGTQGMTSIKRINLEHSNKLKQEQIKFTKLSPIT